MPIELRSWTLDDTEILVQYANNKNVSAYMTDRFPHPYTKQDAEKFISTYLDREPQEVFAIIFDNKPIGAIGAHPQKDVFQKNAELGYWIAEEYWGRGIMTKSIPLIVDYTFNTFDVDRLFGRIFGNNPASRRVMEKCGFVCEAHMEKTLYKGDEFLDEYIYALRRKNWNKT